MDINGLFSWKGKMGRLPFVAYSIFLTMMVYVGTVYSQSLGNPLPDEPAASTVATIQFLIALLEIGIFWMLIGCGVKRLRDMKKNPALMFLLFLPLANVFLWIWLAAAPSKLDTEPQSDKQDWLDVASK